MAIFFVFKKLLVMFGLFNNFSQNLLDMPSVYTTLD